jgi:hypothetical protein
MEIRKTNQAQDVCFRLPAFFNSSDNNTYRDPPLNAGWAIRGTKNQNGFPFVVGCGRYTSYGYEQDQQFYKNYNIQKKIEFLTTTPIPMRDGNPCTGWIEWRVREGVYLKATVIVDKSGINQLDKIYTSLAQTISNLTVE